MLAMLAARESGVPLHEFLDRDGSEFTAWSQYAIGGPSQVRTQMLLAQIIQLVAGALGGKRIPIEDLIPYHANITGSDTPRARAAKRKREREAHLGIVQDLVRRRRKDG